MLHRLKRPWKSRKPANGVPNTSQDHAQSSESQSRLPLKAMTSSELGACNSHAASPAKVEPEVMRQGSSDSDEHKVGNFQENLFTTQGPDQSQHESNKSGVVNPHKAAAATAQRGPWPAEGNVPGMSKRSNLDEEVRAGAKPNRDLWKEAAEKLSEKNRTLLSMIHKEEGNKVVERVVEQTKVSYPEHGNADWKTAFKSALKSVLQCKELINSAISCDPTGHAAAAWTVVSFGLQMAQNEVDRRENVLKACGLLAGNLELMAAFEASYRKKVVPDQSHLEDNIVSVYMAILELSAEIVHENSTNAAHKIFSSFNRLADQPLQEFKETLTEAQQKLRQWTDIIDQQYRIQLAENVSTMLAEMEEMAKQVNIITASVLAKEEEDILQWLSQYPFYRSHNTAVNKQKPCTGDWVFDLPQYETWKKSGRSLLWLYGNCQYTLLQSLPY